MSCWHTLGVNASVIITRFPTTKRAAAKSSLPENCRLSQETIIYKEPLDACHYILAAVQVLFERTSEDFSLVVQMYSANREGLVKLHVPNILGQSPSERHEHDLLCQRKPNVKKAFC